MLKRNRDLFLTSTYRKIWIEVAKNEGSHYPRTDYLTEGTGGDRDNDFPVWLDCNPVCEYVSGLITALGEKV